MNPVFESLIFDSNIFTNLQGPGLYLTRSNSVAVINNRFKNTNLSRVTDPSLNSQGLNGEVVLSHAHHIFHLGNISDHSGPFWIDPKSTSGISQGPRP